MTLLHNLTQGIKNLFYWLPVVWQDRQWDEHFLFLMLRHKLKAIETFFRSKDAVAIVAHKDADHIHRCVLLLNRLIDSPYYDNVDNNEQWAGFTWTYRKMGRHEEYMINQDIRYLMYLLNKYIRTWWD